MLELDRDERKLEAFLHLHKHDLLVADLRIFLPFTINLDPYLRKVLKEDQQALEDEGIIIPIKSSPPMRPLPQMMQQNMAYSPQFGQHSASSYQPYYGQPPPMAPYMPSNVPSFAPAAIGPTEPPSRKKSIIEAIAPIAVENKAQPTEYMNAFPVSTHRTSSHNLHIMTKKNSLL